MRLTVGPLPAAVYWRRRAVVLVMLASAVLVISYACGGPGGRAANADPKASSAGNQARVSPSPTPPRALVPTVSATPGPTAFTLPAAGATGPCTDAEMLVTAVAGSAQVQSSQPVDLTIKIKNISNRTCIRDIGADVQELRLLQGKMMIWSSDDCNSNKGNNVSSFAPGKEVSFTLRWSGRVSRTGTGSPTCSMTAPAPPAGMYELVGRLDQKLSSPFPLRVNS